MSCTSTLRITFDRSLHIARLKSTHSPKCRQPVISKHNPCHRTFTTTSCLYKKASKANKAHAHYDSTPPITGRSQPTSTDEAYDLSFLEAQILQAMEKLTHELGQLRSGGRLNPEVIESLKVQLGNAGKDGRGKESIRLGDVAQVVPRGRMMNVICGEAEYVKPVTSAIAASSHSLTPHAPESSNPLTIQVPLPPPTGETRQAAIDAATKAAERADKTIQSARQNHNKGLRKAGLDRSVLPDDLKKAAKQMEDVVKKGHEDVKRIVQGEKKTLEN